MEKGETRKTVITTVITTVVAGILAWLFGLLQVAWAWITGPMWTWVTGPMWSWLAGPTAVPGWLIITGGLLALLGAFAAALLAMGMLGFFKPRQSWRTDFTSLMFQGIWWRWRWLDNSVDALQARCPHDTTLLRFDSVGAYALAPRFRARCQTCRRETKDLPDPRDLEDSVKVEIDRQLMSGDWQRSAPRTMRKAK